MQDAIELSTWVTWYRRLYNSMHFTYTFIDKNFCVIYYRDVKGPKVFADIGRNHPSEMQFG